MQSRPIPQRVAARTRSGCPATIVSVLASPHSQRSPASPAGPLWSYGARRGPCSGTLLGRQGQHLTGGLRRVLSPLPPAPRPGEGSAPPGWLSAALLRSPGQLPGGEGFTHEIQGGNAFIAVVQQVPHTVHPSILGERFHGEHLSGGVGCHVQAVRYPEQLGGPF